MSPWITLNVEPGVERHDRAVVKRPPRVVEQFHVVVAAIAAHQFVRVVGRTVGHHEDFARFRLDRDDAAHFAFHQFFGQRLQPRVDRTGDRHARRRQRVVNTVRIGAFRDTVHVHHFDFHSFLSAQHFFVGLFDAAAPDVVAAAVVRVAFQDPVVHFADVSQQVARHFSRVRPDGAVNGEESGELVLFEAQFGLFGQLFDDDRRPTAREIGRFDQLLADLFDRYAQDAAHQRGVERPHFARGRHQVVSLFALYQEASVSVVNFAPGRVLHHVAQDVVVCIRLVAAVEHLDIEQPQQDDRRDDDDDSL